MILLVLLLIAAMTVVFLVQNERVYRYRIQLIDQVNALAKRDLVQGREGRWRYDVFDHVSYDAMVLRPWRSLSSWFEGHPSLDPAMTDPLERKDNDV